MRGFGTDWEETLISTIIEEAGGEGEFETVTLGTGAYEALAAGRVDFTLEVSTWEGVNAELEGRPQSAFRYADYGVPDQHTTLIGASGAWLEESPETARAFLEATQRGYAFAAENPEEAADILIEATSGHARQRGARPRLHAGARRGQLPSGRGRRRRAASTPPRSRRWAASCSRRASCATPKGIPCPRSPTSPPGSRTSIWRSEGPARASVRGPRSTGLPTEAGMA